MARPWWQRLFRFASRPVSRPPSHYVRLHLESLEDRTVLSAPTDFATPLYVLSPGHAAPQSSSSPVGLTPSQIRSAYGFNNITFNGVTGDGTGQTIAIVDAYDDPNIKSDLAAFDQQFGISAPPSFSVVNQTGGSTLPGVDSSGQWEVEESLDVEWAHALAPGANIVLVEANSSNNSDLNTAVAYASSLTGVSVISMSYGSSETSGETSGDSLYTTPSGHNGITFVAASGDSGKPGLYPAYSPNVLAVGGTQLTLSNGSYSSESAWNDGGGGISKYEGQPGYQQAVVTQTGSYRTIPDVAFDASPNSGVAIYDSYNYGSTNPWVSVGGTSIGAPSWSALIAIVNQDRASNNLGTLDGYSQTLPTLYKLSSSDFHDITTGNNGYPAGPGYDLATGLGSPVANLLVPDLAQAATPTTLTWTGGGSSSNWSDPGNWGGTAPVAGDTLVFGPGVSALNSNNDFAAGTLFKSIVFTGSGYSISGNAVVLTGGIDASAATGNNTVALNLALGGNATIQAGGSGTTLTVSGNIANHGNTLTVAGGSGAVVLSGTLSGIGGLVQSSSGTLALSGSGGNTYTGPTTVQSGTLLLNESGGPALGGSLTVSGGSSTALAQWLASNQLASGAALTANSNGTVDLNGSSDSASSLTLAGGTVQTEAGTLTLRGNISSSGTSTISGNLALSAASTTVTVATSSTLTVSAAVSGQASLTKAGGGTLVLSGNNTYTGGTTLSLGTLSLGSSTAVGTGTLALTAGTLTGSGSAQTLANAVTLGGNVIIGGTVGLTFSGNVTLTGNRTLTDNNTATTTLSGVIGQSGSTAYGLTKAGAGTLVLSGANTFAGGLTLNGGTLSLGNGSAAGTGTLTLTAGTLTASGSDQTLSNAVTLGGNAVIGGTLALTFTGNGTLTGNRSLAVNNTATTTFSGAIGQSGSTAYGLTKTGTGTLVLSGANTFSGGLTLSGGTLSLGNASAAGTGTLTLSAGTLTASGSDQTLSNAVTLGGNITFAGSNGLTFTGAATLTGSRNLTVNTTTTFSGVIGQSGSTAYGLTKLGTGTLVLSGANTYTGGTTLNGGTLSLGNGAAAGTGTLTLTSGTLTASGGDQSLANALTLQGNVTLGGSNALTFTGNATLTGSRTLTVSNTSTFSGAIGQSGSTAFGLTKAGSGTLVLSGNNTYTGSTTVNAGTLLVNGTQGSGTVTVNNTATLGGSGSMGPITVASGGTLLPGTGSSSPAVLNSGNLTLKSGATFNEALDGATAGSGGYGQLDASGTVTLSGSTLSLSLGFTPTVGETFTLIKNNGGHAVVGTFSGLAEGATLTVNGMTFQISYRGGSGNDVVLTRTA